MTTRLLYGAGPFFNIPHLVLSNPLELFFYFALGILAGLLSLLFIGILFSLSRIYQALRVPDWLTPAVGGLLLALTGIICPWALGVGYESINLSLAGNMTLSFVLLLICTKLFATSICIGSGMSGGIFAPSLVLGAMLGTIVGFGAQHILPHADIVPAYYALIGMGAMVSGTTLAPITAILTILELSGNYDVILPLMIACIASLMVVRLLYGYSVYETKLLRKGIDIVKGHEVNILRAMRVIDHMSRDLQLLHTDNTYQEIINSIDENPHPHFIVLDEKEMLAGVLTLTDFKSLFVHPEIYSPELKVDKFMVQNVVTVSEESNMEEAFHQFITHRISFLPVVSNSDPKKVVGQLRKQDLFSAYEQSVFKQQHLPAPLGWFCPWPSNKFLVKRKTKTH